MSATRWRPPPEAERARPHQWMIAGLSILLVIVVLCILAVRALGESKRISDANDAQDRRIQANIDRIEQDIRADCQFKYDVANLPFIAMKNDQKLTPTLVQLAQDARVAYVRKGCPGSINPATGKRFGPPPPQVVKPK